MAEAPRRSTRKRRAVVQEDAATEEDVDAVIANEERELELAAKTRPNEPKRRRTEAHAHKPPFETIPVDLLPAIMLFLDSARDVYNLASCSKQLRQAITPEIVVRSAVFSGGKTRAAIADIMDAVKKQNIHVPSTLRLLRLVNATKCERLEECFAYDLVKQVSGDCSKNRTRPFGLLICQDCVRNCSSKIWDHFARNDRVARLLNARVLYKPHTEVATGERAGPFVFVKNELQIKNSYRKEEERKEALTGMLEEVDENTPSEVESRANAFLGAHETAEQKFAAFEQAKHACRAVERERDAKTVKRAAKKMKNVRAVYTILEQLLDGYEHKNLVLQCTWNERSGTCTLKHEPAEQKLGPLLNAPSGATQKKLITATDSVREAFDLVQSKGFIGPNFLSFLSNSQLRHERALYSYCLRTKTGSALLSEVDADDRFLELLREGKLVDALLRVLHSEDMKFAFASQVAAESVASAHRTSAEYQQESTRVKSLLEKLAAQVWSHIRRPETFRQTFDRCRSEFMALTSTVQRYMEHPQTVAFLSETGPPPNHPNQVFTRQNAVDKIYEHRLCFHYLGRGDFEQLRSIHERMFLNPRAYGYSRNNAN